jgi:hypothetical protein
LEVMCTAISQQDMSQQVEPTLDRTNSSRLAGKKRVLSQVDDMDDMEELERKRCRLMGVEWNVLMGIPSACLILYTEARTG